MISLVAAAPLVVAIYWLLGRPIPSTPWFARWLRLAGEGRAIKVVRDAEAVPLELESADETAPRDPRTRGEPRVEDGG